MLAQQEAVLVHLGMLNTWGYDRSQNHSSAAWERPERVRGIILRVYMLDVNGDVFVILRYASQQCIKESPQWKIVLCFVLSG